MKLLVTGGAGFIGSAFVRLVITKGFALEIPGRRMRKTEPD